MALPLLTPQGSNFIKDFPAQNAVNCDLIDVYAGPCLITHPLRSLTPILGGTGGNPVLGTGGINVAYYYQIFDQIYMWGEWRWGTAGTDFGGGFYTLDLPFAINDTWGIGGGVGLEFGPVVGSGVTFDASANAGLLPLTVHARSTTQLLFGIRMNSGSSNRELRSAGYVTWAISDGVSWSARVQKAP